MAEEDDFPISTVNLDGVRAIAHENLDEFGKDGLLVFGGVETARQVVVLTNRIVDEYKYVVGMSRYGDTDSFLMVYYKRY